MVSCSHLGLRLTGVVLPNKLVIDEIEAQATEVQVSYDPWGLALPEGGIVIARISASSLAAFLNLIQPGGLTDCSVAIREGRVIVEGSKKMFITIRAAVSARLVAEGGTKLMVELLGAEAMGADIKGMIQAQIASINPLLNCEDLPIKARIESIAATDDKIVLKLAALGE